MKHICGENGCRWVTNEEYERLMKLEKEKSEPKEEVKKKESLFLKMLKR